MYETFDQQYIKLAKTILTEGTRVIGRNSHEYLQIFGQTIRINLLEEFPILTLRRMPVKNLIREFLWDVNGHSDVNLLGKAKHFWDFLADENDQLPNSYGSSWRHWPINIPRNAYEKQAEVFRSTEFDQLKFISDSLKTNPTNRQLVLTTLNPANKPREDKFCPPCHPSVIFSSDGEYLDVLVTARSWDLATGVSLDVFRYALLTKCMARDANLVARYLQITSANNHIYTKNKANIEKIISREPLFESNPLVKISKSLFELTEEDITIDNYLSYENVRMAVAQ